MICHTELGNTAFSRFRTLHSLIAVGKITLAGYKKTKIYGTLACKAGKRMHTTNRVFFSNEQEALNKGYRPCGNCMPEQYKIWKLENEKNK